jgi:hypothetical protein
MEESTWVRSVYLYLVCALALLAIAFGSVAGVMGVSRIISPSLGHRDSLDRVGIGLSNVAENVIARLDQSGNTENEQYCRDVTGDEVEFQSCMADMGSGSMPTDEVLGGIADVRSEFEHQIRGNATAQLIRGLMLVLVGLLLWRAHAHRTVLYGKVRLAPSAAAGGHPAPATAAVSAPAAASPQPPPPPPTLSAPAEPPLASGEQPLNEFD